MGKRAFFQSLHPMSKNPEKRKGNVAILGLDSEYIPRANKGSDLICWQLASDDSCILSTKKFSLQNLYRASCGMVSSKADTFVFVVFFSLAEIQFFDLSEWKISEFKGHYQVQQDYQGKKLITVDLAQWFPSISLEKVAEFWGLKKLDFPIVERVKAIERGEATKEDLLADEAFREYAQNDAKLTQRIYSQMREYFWTEYEIDILSSLTPAQTSAWMFRRQLEHTIDQRDTKLRKLALGCCWGGRTECFYRGERKQVYEYDATGHHPNSAIALKALPESNDWIKTQDLKQWLLPSNLGGLGKVYFRFPDSETYPCLPIYHEGSLIFPLEGISFCTTFEAMLAQKLGAKMILLEGYHYQRGTDVLTRYLQELQTKRNASDSTAYRELLKLLSNSIIGKFFQKSTGANLQEVQKYAKEHQLPMEEVINLKGVNFEKEVLSVGSCFYPEWYALILGYARASISEAIKDYSGLIASSDAFATNTFIGLNFTLKGITFRLKHQGDYIGYRSRLYRIGDKLAHHAIHNKEASKEILDYFHTEGEFAYKNHRILHLRESWKVKMPFGTNIERDMIVFLNFDYKRKLLPSGETLPWQNTKEREEFLGGINGSHKEASV